MFGVKLLVWVALGVGLLVGRSWYDNSNVTHQQELAMDQLDDTDSGAAAVRDDVWRRNALFVAGTGSWLFMGFLFFWNDICRLLNGDSRQAVDDEPSRPMGTRKRRRSYLLIPFALAAASGASGCWRPYEPNHLEVIGSNEEGFLIPLTGNTKKQVSTASEEFLAQNLVQAKQVRIPQQWVQKGYEWGGLWPWGDWYDAAVLIKVDKQPVTREWTADPASGTSNKNEAIWVMTADQVEFSTGWTCTARIPSKDDAIKFLHNYPNGSLATVMDREIRAMIQTTFGLETTDLPMEKLRLQATPHIQSVVNQVKGFFEQRGIQITNLGISGGFVYKNPTIEKKLVEVFNAEQEKAIAAAATAAQDERNKRIMMEAEGRATALLTEKNAEAKGIQAVADAKAYEIEKAQQNKELYIALKRIELEANKLRVWNGNFPAYFMGGGGVNTPDMLLQVPAFDVTPPAHRTGAIPPAELINNQ